MANFSLKETKLKGAYLVDVKAFKDQRGYFMETFQEACFRAMGIQEHFVQDNESRSTKGVLRGLHFQSKHTQAKLVRVIKGEIYDVIVDLRKGSPTFKKAEAFILSEENRRQLYIPRGFAHGFLVLSDEAVFSYKCTDFYDPEYEGGIMWDDPELEIVWPLDRVAEINLSEKDTKWPKVSECISNFIYEEPILGEEISLIPLQKKDIEQLRQWRNVESSQKRFCENPIITTAMQIKWYEQYENNAQDKMFVIYVEEQPVGISALYHIDMQNKEAEFGRLLIGDLSMRGKKIGVKATRLLCQYGFEQLGLERIRLEVFKENIAALKTYQKVGFKVIATYDVQQEAMLQMVCLKQDFVVNKE